MDNLVALECGRCYNQRVVDAQCKNCNKPLKVYPSRLKNSGEVFCNKSCYRSFRNRIDNPSLHRDLSGANNPMFGKHPVAWNKGLKGELSHNWKGGIHKRKDGYIRIRIDGKRYLQHRILMQKKLTDLKQIVHHLDKNPSNNNPDNLVVLENQAEHARLHALLKHE